MILFVSNGSGEDAIATRILKLVHTEAEIVAMPLVGAGSAYPEGIRRIGVQPPVPSQGLANESWRLFVRDLRHGLIGRLVRQVESLRRVRPTLVVAVGDLVPLCLSGWRASTTLFIGTAKSSHHHPYSWLERSLIARLATHTFPRDLRTAAELSAHGLSASFVGNAMMDELKPTGLELGLQAPGIALLPGSRDATYAELPRMLATLTALRTRVEGLVALAEGIEPERLAAACAGWQHHPTGTTSGVVAELVRPGAPRVRLLRRSLGDVLAASQLCLGQAGTANEQAAGAGLPVVAVHRGTKLGWYRGRQKGLLGEALEVVPPEGAVPALERLLADPSLRERRAAVGRERLGPPGGAQAMADWISARAR